MTYPKESKGTARDLLKRTFDQNERALGLFYLHPEADSGIALPSLILLRVAITLRIQHYETLQNARCGRLSTE